jgi:hypothetical protein|tara:strand:+ start:325 stop:516 length:192 start_codon:yes stop_codon:yes gene_type:complete
MVASSLTFAQLVKNSQDNQEKMLGRPLTPLEIDELEVPPATPSLTQSRHLLFPTATKSWPRLG